MYFFIKTKPTENKDNTEQNVNIFDRNLFLTFYSNRSTPKLSIKLRLDKNRSSWLEQVFKVMYRR